MRPPGLSDALAVARALAVLPPDARAGALDDVLARARAADAYRKRFGRWHPAHGCGSLTTAVGGRAKRAEPDLTDDDWCRLLAYVLTGIADARADARRRGGGRGRAVRAAAPSPGGRTS